MLQEFGGLRSLLRMALALVLLAASPALAANYGDNTSEYANDGECDDLRFVGPGMEGVTLIDDDVLHDAADCKKMVLEGSIRYFGDDVIDFGDDGGDYSRDNECDDPRFTGPGMTTTPLLAEDIMADASDCRRAYENGDLWMR